MFFQIFEVEIEMITENLQNICVILAFNSISCDHESIFNKNMLNGYSAGSYPCTYFNLSWI